MLFSCEAMGEAGKALDQVQLDLFPKNMAK